MRERSLGDLVAIMSGPRVTLTNPLGATAADLEEAFAELNRREREWYAPQRPVPEPDSADQTKAVLLRDLRQAVDGGWLNNHHNLCNYCEARGVMKDFVWRFDHTPTCLVTLYGTR
jgi:hypothetical protein